VSAASAATAGASSRAPEALSTASVGAASTQAVCFDPDARPGVCPCVSLGDMDGVAPLVEKGARVVVHTRCYDEFGFKVDSKQDVGDEQRGRRRLQLDGAFPVTTTACNYATQSNSFWAGDNAAVQNYTSAPTLDSLINEATAGANWGSGGLLVADTGNMDFVQGDAGAAGGAGAAANQSKAQAVWIWESAMKDLGWEVYRTSYTLTPTGKQYGAGGDETISFTKKPSGSVDEYANETGLLSHDKSFNVELPGLAWDGEPASISFGRFFSSSMDFGLNDAPGFADAEAARHEAAAAAAEYGQFSFGSLDFGGSFWWVAQAPPPPPPVPNPPLNSLKEWLGEEIFCPRGSYPVTMYVSKSTPRGITLSVDLDVVQYLSPSAPPRPPPPSPPPSPPPRSEGASDVWSRNSNSKFEISTFLTCKNCFHFHSYMETCVGS